MENCDFILGIHKQKRHCQLMFCINVTNKFNESHHSLGEYTRSKREIILLFRRKTFRFIYLIYNFSFLLFTLLSVCYRLLADGK